MTDHNSPEAMDAVWERFIARGTFTEDWYRQHPITGQLLAQQGFSGTVLDAGCGLGVRTHLAAEAWGCSVVGVDHSSVAIAYARAHYPEGHYWCGDVCALECMDGQFDGLFALAVLEHIADLDALCEEWCRVCRPGSPLFFSVTESDTHGYAWHLHRWNAPSWRRFLSEHFVVERAYAREHVLYARVRSHL